MSFGSYFAKVEAEARGLFASLPSEAQVVAFVAKETQATTSFVINVEISAEQAYAWIGANGPAVIKDIDAVMAVVLEVVSVTDPRVATAVAAVNVFTGTLNALVAAKAAGQDLVTGIKDAYGAYQTMQAAAANAKAAVTTPLIKAA